MYKKIVHFLASSIFFWLIWIVAIVQASWIALISRYPMAFDEAYHFNLIKLHAKQWGPLFLHQPPGPAPYGALVRDPSYVYHYLLSFPYRFLEFIGVNERSTIIYLRFVSIALFAVGLLLFRKLLYKTKASPAAINASFLFFIMIPTVPLLAGQLNYDNLQFPLMALAILLVVNFAAKLRDNKVDINLLVSIITICIVGTLNKFTFLPIITAVAIYISYILTKFYLSNRARAIKSLKKDWQSLSSIHRFLLAVFLAVASGFFMWSYGVNIAKYNNPVPPCHLVLSKKQCQASETWVRNDKAAATNNGVNANPVIFTYNWIIGMHYRLFFTINGATGPKKYENHTAIGVTATAAVMALFGGLLFCRFGKRILSSDSALTTIIFISLFYFMCVWGRNFNDYLHLGQLLAINGRYLQPLLLPVILVLITSYQWAFRNNPKVKLGLIVISFLLCLSGGGITGFIHYSNSDWYFQNNLYMTHLNSIAKKIITPLFLWRS